MQTPINYGDQVGTQVITPTTAAGFTASLIKPTSGAYKGRVAQVAVVHPIAQDINYRCDGTAAVAGACGRAVKDRDTVIVGYRNIKNFSCIDTADGASTVHVLFYF